MKRRLYADVFGVPAEIIFEPTYKKFMVVGVEHGFVTQQHPRKADAIDEWNNHDAMMWRAYKMNLVTRWRRWWRGRFVDVE